MMGPVPRQPAEGKPRFQRITTPPSFLHCPSPKTTLLVPVQTQNMKPGGSRKKYLVPLTVLIEVFLFATPMHR